ncbi:MAG: transposase [Pirellulales bacterium]|nr:transposase [Pirellulales bacterium]
MSDKRRITDDELYAHFLSFSVARRRKLFSLDHPKRILLGVLNQQLENWQARCVGFVIMPDHVHAIIWLSQIQQLSDFMRDWKRHSSFHIRNWYRDTAPKYFAEFSLGDKFWQAKYYPFAIYTRKKMEEKLTYMHQNPVRAGLVAKAADWRWSSARWYHGRRSVGVPIRWVECD